MNFREAFNCYFEKDGFINFAFRYARILLGDTGYGRGEAVVDHGLDEDEVEKQAKAILNLTTRAFALFHALVSTARLELDEVELLTIERALHESLFTVLYRIDSKCNELLEMQLARAEDDDTEAYLKRLAKIHPVAKNDLPHLLQKWFLDVQRTAEAVFAGEYALRIFSEDGEITFQVFDENLDPVINAPTWMRSGNLLVSRFYFALRIFDIFRHLDLVTTLLTSVKAISVPPLSEDFVDLSCVQTLTDTAKELLERET